jgi:hypothetical protein
MKRPYSILPLLIALAADIQITAAQTPTRSLTAGIESGSGELQLHLTNSDNIREFRGSAKIGFENPSPTNKPISVELRLAPGESRLFPLDSSALTGEQYTLTIYNHAGALVLVQVAFIKQASDALSSSGAPEDANDLTIQAQLSRISPNSEAEIQVPDESIPCILTFELAAKTPIVNANLTISAKDFKRHRQVTVRGQTKVEFNLPDELVARKLKYVLTDRVGRVRASGEVDLDQLTDADSTSTSSFKLDRASYSPGDIARVVIDLKGESPRGYRLQVAVMEGTNIFFEDERKGASHGGRSQQEFTFELPREAKGAIVFEYKVFGRQTGALFDSGSYIINLSEESARSDAGSRSSISP